MHETSLPEDSAGLVAGRLEGMSIPDLMWLLFRRQATGVLHLSRRDLAKRIFFQDGHIVFAASSDPNDRLGEMLLREGLIDLEQLEDAISKLYLGRRLGTLLVEMGHLRPEDLVRGVIAQVREIVLEPFTWEEGAYRFDDGPLPLDEVVTLGMKTGEILMQGIRRIRSFTRIRRRSWEDCRSPTASGSSCSGSSAGVRPSRPSAARSTPRTSRSIKRCGRSGCSAR
jgi:hypothetical protein